MKHQLIAQRDTQGVPRSSSAPLTAVMACAMGAALLFQVAAVNAQSPSAPLEHFHPLGTSPSRFTLELRNGAKQALPFNDQRDFEESKRGLLAVPAFTKIMADAGNVAWDMGSYSFLLQGKDFDSIHPSLQRQAILNMGYGLYEVIPNRIYQVRGFDLANISVLQEQQSA